MLIKVCGVRTPEIAHFAAQKGAHFVGMILTPGYPRSVSIETARQIVKATKQAQAEPVAVFVSETPEEVQKICAEIGVQIVQYYQTKSVLPACLKRIYVNAPQAYLRANTDLLLLEGSKPGSSDPIDDKNFARPSHPFLIAGGLTPENIEEKIRQFLPSGVDVSSGVEKNGHKCPERIAQFIEKVKSHA